MSENRFVGISKTKDQIANAGKMVYKSFFLTVCAQLS